jgi:outer membrane protein assembly factor BamB
MSTRILVAMVVLACCCVAAYADPPIGWRNDTSGAFPGAAPTAAWSPDEHVLWKARLPGGSNGSPIVIGERVFVCAEPARLICLSAGDGGVAWEADLGYDSVLSEQEWQAAQRDLEQGDRLRKQRDDLRNEITKVDESLQADSENQVLKDRREDLSKQVESLEAEMVPLDRYRQPERSAGCTTATPLCDGRHVYVVFGGGVVACFDLEGNRRWARLFDKSKLDWGHTASPLLAGGQLLVHLTDLIALDPDTGRTQWTATVPANYGSAVVCRVGNEDLIVTSAADVVRADDGAVLAQGIAERLRASSPVARGDTVYFIEARARAVRLPADLSAGGMPETIWETNLFEDNYYASPLLHDGLLYAVSENRMLTVLDADDGEVAYERRLRFAARGAVTSSISAAGDQVLITQENGATKVLRAGRTYEELAENPLESLRSSPVLADGRLYIRGHEHLYCIGE